MPTEIRSRHGHERLQEAPRIPLTSSLQLSIKIGSGAPPSPIKFDSWLDILLRWIEKEGVNGVKLVRQNPDGSYTTVELHTLAFADDLLLLTETIEDMQKLVNLVDRFLRLFGVSL